MNAWEDLEERVSAAIGKADPAVFDGLALEVFEFQRQHNLPYAQYCRSLGVPERLTDWREIPVVPQAAFKHAALRAFPATEEIASFRTSGTTGEGYGVHHFRSLRLYDKAILRGWDLLGLPPLPQVILIPPPGEAPHSSLSHMMGVLRARAMGGEQCWCVHPDTGLDIGRLNVLMDCMIDIEQPVLLLGTALAFLHWFEATGRQLPLPSGSVAFETGGYKGSGRSLSKGELYEKFRQQLGLDPDSIINEYGMTELSSQCYTRGFGNPHIAPPWTRVLVVDPSTGREVANGELGLLRIYDLANLGSVMGIQTRDLAIRRHGDFELLGRDPAALPRGCSRAADDML